MDAGIIVRSILGVVFSTAAGAWLFSHGVTAEGLSALILPAVALAESILHRHQLRDQFPPAPPSELNARGVNMYAGAGRYAAILFLAVIMAGCTVDQIDKVDHAARVVQAATTNPVVQAISPAVPFGEDAILIGGALAAATVATDQILRRHAQRTA